MRKNYLCKCFKQLHSAPERKQKRSKIKFGYTYIDNFLIIHLLDKILLFTYNFIKI